MGEYADLYWRKEMKDTLGFDPGSMYGEENRKPKVKKPRVKCPLCGKKVIGLSDHQRDYHKIKELK